MGFGIDYRARSRKARAGLRSLLGRAPDAADVGNRLVRLAKRTYDEAVVDATPKRITLQLHAAASPVTLAILPDGDLEVRGETSVVGPGYHTHVVGEVGTLLDEIDYVWEREPPDHAAVQRQMAQWFADQLRAGVTTIGMPADRSFVIDGAVVHTALGPRDARWRDRVLADPMVAADAFPWWENERGHGNRAAALYTMWHEVPWREPIDDEERELLQTVVAELWAATRANPSIARPDAELADIYEWLGMDAHAAQTREKLDGARATIGYRRYPMEIELSGGWSVVLPGAFVSHWVDDETRWVATDGERAVEMSSITVGNATDSAKLLAVAPEAHPVLERFVDGNRHGRLEVHDEADIHVMHGLVAQAPHVAFLTCKSRRRDEAWAIAAWKSLANQPA